VPFCQPHIPHGLTQVWTRPPWWEFQLLALTVILVYHNLQITDDLIIERNIRHLCAFLRLNPLFIENCTKSHNQGLHFNQHWSYFLRKSLYAVLQATTLCLISIPFQ
jgi:hypothetical protein